MIRKIYILLFIPLLVLIHLISPILFIRIGVIRSDRLGHLGLDLELSMCLEKEKVRKQESSFPKELNLFCTIHPISNHYLLRLWQEKLIILPSWFIIPLDKIIKKIDLFSKYNFFEYVSKSGHKDFSLLDLYPPILTIPNKGIEEGKKLLKDLGITPGQPYICLAVRDSEYLNRHLPENNWAYHDFRDSKIENYIEMSEYFASKGFAVLRMGKFMKGTFASHNSNIIDYANSKFQSDFADVFLFANCYMCISTSTGMDSLASIFRVPVGLVNVVNIGSVAIGELVKLFQPKVFIEKISGRELTYVEIIERQLFSLSSSSELEVNGVALIENTPKELKLFATEILETLIIKNRKINHQSFFNNFSNGDSTLEKRISKISKFWLENHPGYFKKS